MSPKSRVFSGREQMSVHWSMLLSLVVSDGLTVGGFIEEVAELPSPASMLRQTLSVRGGR